MLDRSISIFNIITQFYNNSIFLLHPFLSVEEQIKNSTPVDILGKIANIRVEKDTIAIEIDLRKANFCPPQPEPEEVENDPPNGLI
jgi:hypothetical protein